MSDLSAAAVLADNAYGKSRVRLTKVVRDGDRHQVLEMSVDIRLHGDFAASYTDGDNTRVVATDSMKNTVYVLARENQFASIDAFAALLVRHFVDTYGQVTAAEAAIEQTMFDRIAVDGRPHAHAFTGGRGDRRTCRFRLDRGGTMQRSGGVTDLVVLKSGGSQFVDFVDDRYRTLPDTTERIFATSIDATWRYPDPSVDPEGTITYDEVRAAFLACFAIRHSLAVQQTLLEMGEAALVAAPAIDRVELTLPNQHRVPFNLEPFGLDNPATIFVPTDEPFGLISGAVERVT
ncbi:MAG: factor-independent urate hydroxylase [Planctomycetota bacterium]